MLRKYALFAGVAALGALVTSCGDDDPTPTPTPSESPSPTPTPTSSQVDFDLTMDFVAEVTNANLSYAFFTADGSMDTVFSGASRTNGTSGIALAFSPESATFSFPDLADAVVFTDADFDAATATTRRYERTDEALLLEVPFEHVLRVTYELEQDFTQDTTDGRLASNRTSLFFNSVTTDSEITANITYDGSFAVFGGDPLTTEAGAITAPDITVTVEPGAAADDADTISGTIRIFEDVNGTITEVAVLPFDAELNTVSGFNLTITDTANALSGNLSGALAGPDRDEVIIIFSVSSTETDNDTRYVGTFIGDR
ncbi:hypothetical protein [Aurantiacibacter gangjinensis]|uniref:Uncharacterized protein n=1 Tax=Aurantiacibacter gangjinensis TaxID=502682 RepID=A0A0G9MMN9_9SPHN|nr:hypothetical protein [Aurantiacibacter gangjinensis]APE28030.1 hypothetical protein BMF35_a1201 [Aurantiacibacter gangjinensis]KLE31960.1 hypothetical protein AAW01_11005 [Aurantiacibacter gangjinensis]